ncbi:hypothetical protein F5Y19DRAFT_479563 [Xylariaceae sp. FL1651]|nr:hypothetical protein F5Y19DRAFT_479563 [Xylariaceae sp. FL1651]
MPAKPQPLSDGDVDISYELEVGTTVTFIAAAVVVVLRYYTRWKYSQRGWDDYVMVFALLLALVATIIDYVAAANGLGRHTFFLTPQKNSAPAILPYAPCFPRLDAGPLRCRARKTWNCYGQVEDGLLGIYNSWAIHARITV